MRQEMLAVATLEKRLAVIDKTLIGHDAALRDLYQKIRPLLQERGVILAREPGEIRLCG